MRLRHFIFGAVLTFAAPIAVLGQNSTYGVPASVFTNAGAYAAPSTPNADDPNHSVLTIRKRVDEVNVLFIATDKRGKFVRNLNQNDFSILDDNKPPQSILNFRRETDLPIELGLLVDVSGSVNSRFDFEQEAAVSFLQHVVRAGFDKAFVMGFNHRNEISQDFTDNVTLLQTGVK